MADILCLGEPLIEFNQQDDGLFLQGFGGDISNVAISAARQGAQAGILTQLGSDPFGDQFIELWQSESVITRHVARKQEGETGLYFVTHDNDGHHFTYRRRASAAREYNTGLLPIQALNDCQIFYASGISLAISQTSRDAVVTAAKCAREAGNSFAFDPNLRTALWPLEEARHVTHEVMQHCDIALPGLDDARQLTGLDDPHEILRFYHDMGARTVALTMGSSGVITSDASGTHLCSPLRVDAVDATGAGDCFNGAFLAALLRGMPPADATHWANTAAALSTCGFGAVAPIPTLSQTENQLKEPGDPYDN